MTDNSTASPYSASTQACLDGVVAKYNASSLTEPRQIKDWLGCFDADANSMLSSDEICSNLNCTALGMKADQIMSQIDTDGDGIVSMSEFDSDLQGFETSNARSVLLVSWNLMGSWLVTMRHSGPVLCLVFAKHAAFSSMDGWTSVTLRQSQGRVAGNMEKATQSTHRHAPLVPAAEENAVDLATKHAGRKVWLIKVPEFVAKEWRRACHDTTSSAPKKPSQQDDNGLTTEDQQHKQEPDRTTATMRQQGESPVILGTLSIGQGVTLHLSDSFEETKELPKEYNLVNNARAGPSMMVFSDDGDGLYRSVEGIVQHRLDVNARDIQDAYRRVSRERFKREAEGGSRKKRTVKMMTDSKIIDIRKPVGAVQKKKERKDTLLLEKRVAMDKKELLPVLFRLFQRQSQWTFTQLQKETNQPTQHLKSVLGEIAMQNKAGPYKDMWELSKESKVHV